MFRTRSSSVASISSTFDLSNSICEILTSSPIFSSSEIFTWNSCGRSVGKASTSISCLIIFKIPVPDFNTGASSAPSIITGILALIFCFRLTSRKEA